MQKIVAIVGPTASGKSDLAVDLALQFNGEVISADSRQVYRGLNIGTGKVTKKEMRGVSHHLLDIASPTRVFSVAQFKKHADQAIARMRKTKKLPILCGGTGFYIRAVTDGLDLPPVKANTVLRKKLSRLSAQEMYELLQKKDPERAMSIDSHNPHRLIRALEIVEQLGSVPKLKTSSPYDTLFIGIEVPNDVLLLRIHERLQKRIRQGMLREVEHLHKEGLSWKRMEDLGLEYRHVARYLQKKITRTEMLDQLEKEIFQYAKRQYTWFRKNKHVQWITIGDTKIPKELVSNFLSP